jgi:alpha-glucosidase
MRHFILFALLALAAPLVAAAEPATVAAVESPGHVLRVSLQIDNDGRIAYRIDRHGKPVIAPSGLGFLLSDGGKLERNFALESQSTRSADSTWEQPWGENRLVRDNHVELRARFAETKGAQRRLDVVFRVFDDGVGFRYEFPDQPALHDVKIADELTEFVFAAPASAWWIPAGEWNRYEYLYNHTPLDQVGQAHTPITLRTNGGLHIAVHEAALVDYSAMWLRRVDGQRFRAQLSPSSEGWKVRRAAPFTTPWRTLQIADSAAALYAASNLILNLNEPNVLGDVSWVKPAKYVGIWWSLHLETQSWASGAKHGATTAETRRYIDFAAAHGFRGVLVEGWNPGWDGDWFSNGWDFDFTRPTPDFDLPALAAYAASKGVHLIGHHETGCAVSHYESQLEPAFAFYAANGVDQVKTGYVCDAGQIERQDSAEAPVRREWHDGQWQVGHHLRVVQAAARHHIAVNAHEPVKDTGLRRTYPNWLAREGARGQEYMAWGNPKNPPSHEPTLVFTRMLSGPMDFTPGVLSLRGRGDTPIPSTLTRQLAQYVVIYSPIQMAADLPENYAKFAGPFRFIEEVAVDWEQTRVLNGEVGEFVTIARQARGSDDWFLGSLTDEQARALTVPLSFLAPGKRYEARIHRDGDDADFRTNQFAYAYETRVVTAADTLEMKLAAGGGQAIHFVALPD